MTVAQPRPVVEPVSVGCGTPVNCNKIWLIDERTAIPVPLLHPALAYALQKVIVERINVSVLEVYARAGGAREQDKLDGRVGL